MTAPRDKFGRPIVVVTGMGVVTSLGAGKEDNWARLTAGESGIRTVTRFPIDGLKTTMAGTVDFVTVDPSSSTGLTERLADIATEEALGQSGIGSKGDFPGPLFLAVAPVEVEWPQRIEVGQAIGKADFDVNDVLAVSGGGSSVFGIGTAAVICFSGCCAIPAWLPSTSTKPSAVEANRLLNRTVFTTASPNTVQGAGPLICAASYLIVLRWLRF